MTLVRRKLDVTFRLGKGSFGESGFDTVKLSGMRCSANITSGDSVTTAELNLRLFGANLSVMNQLTILNQDYAQRLGKSLNYVTLEAGDEGGSMAVVFTGGIIEAWADFTNPPDSSFVVTATTGLVDRYKPASPASYPGSADAVLMMQDIAARMQRRFENNGVGSIILRDHYLHGSLFEQMQDLRRTADFNAAIDEVTGNLVIWPRNGSRGGQIPLISKDTGMVGYPAYTQFGVQVSALYTPGVAPGGKVRIQSAVLPPSAGEWYVYLVGHDLESEMPDGKWFTHFEASIVPEERRYAS